jgi:hypothetical protein
VSLGPFGHKIRQGLGLDCRLRARRLCRANELECPLGDPSRGEMVPDNFSKPK